MAGYGIKQARQEAHIAKSRHAEATLCGGCGEEVSASEILCTECKLDTLVGTHEEEMAVIG